MNNLELRKSGFSLWCDFIERGFLEQSFPTLLGQNAFYGATSNPSIFSNSIRTSPLYKENIHKLKGKYSPKEIYENLALSDIKTAATIMLNTYKQNQDDGYISIEIDPRYSNDINKSIEEGKRIYKTLNMPNVMIKVPATNEGYEVMESLAKEGININATLIFSPEQTKNTLLALKSLKGDARAVISVFVSRFDRAVKCDLDASLGIANANICYEIINTSNQKNIRTLFASTGLKDGSKKADFYLDAMAYQNTINTAPLESIHEFISKTHTIKTPKDRESNLAILSKYDMPSIYQNLLDEGLKAFVSSFEEMFLAL